MPEARVPVRIPPGDYRVIAWSFDGRVAEGRARLSAERTRIEMCEPTGGIVLTVLRPDGAPGKGVDIVLASAGGESPLLTRRLARETFRKPAFVDEITGTTDAAGTVAFPGLWPGRYGVRIGDRRVEVEVGTNLLRRTVWLE
jgi:hypothetical protein